MVFSNSEAQKRDSGRDVRFSFGRNWKSFLKVLNAARINEAERSLQEMLGLNHLKGISFLDVGSGSGLFSLAAVRLGARVHSFDYDLESVGCTKVLKQQFAGPGSEWIVEEGSVLDSEFIARLGQYNVVYSWGVLHHTGDLWRAIENTTRCVAPKGQLYLAIYNDQGLISKAWKCIKRLYCSSIFLRIILVPLFFTAFFLVGLVSDILRLKNPAGRYRDHVKHRGMSLCHDWLDWLGGYPYEPAAPERVIDFVEKQGFSLVRLKPPVIGFGNNQYLFVKRS
jgi:2-polyprenyl-3-methyl-5-hydroxy-6-metoxy-1,4-benzoquinol methylase